MGIESLDVIGGLALALFGFIVGRRERNLRKPTQYPCECGHSLAMHRPGDGKKVRTDCMKNACACAQYVGPRPFDASTLSD